MRTLLRRPGVFPIALLLSVLFLASDVIGQITQPVPWANAYNINTTSLSGTGFTFSIAPGSNRLLVVAIATNSGGNSGTVADPTTITYGGATLTKATGNGGTSARMHTWLYYLKDNAVMNNTLQALNVTMGTANQTNVNFNVWYTVFSGVNQSPSSYTVGDNNNNNNGSGPVVLGTAMTVNAEEQAVSIENILNNGSTTIPATTIATNWTTGGSNSASVANAWKVEVAKRSIPVANTSDNVSTTITSAGTNYRWAISTMSLPPALIPVLAITGTTNHGASCLGIPATTITYTITNTGNAAANGIAVNSNNAGFVVSNLSSTTIAAGGGTATYQVTFTPTSSGLQNATITITSTTAGSNSPTSSLTGTGNGTPVTSVVGQSNVNCFAGSDGSITIGATGGTGPYFYSVNNGTTWTATASPSPFTYNGLSANTQYRIRVKDSNGCLSK